jgi:Icc-related predicted phosphoesterase
MRILGFSDFHGLFGLRNHFRDVKKKLLDSQPDILVFCGDFRNDISIPLLKSRMRRLQVPKIYYVWGNSDNVKPEYDLKVGINLHLKVIPLTKEFGIAGIGGDELDVQWNIESLEKQLSGSTLKLILVSHVPPFGFCDYAADQKHVGSRPLRALVERFKPIAHLFGHIHEDSHKQVVYKGITFVNVGPNSCTIDL